MGNKIELRSGLVIYLSSHPHDAVTVFVIFVCEDYGEIQKGSVVVDVGGNIGIFALFAAYKGAKKVYVYEPNSESCQIIRKNVHANGLDEVIFVHQNAVTSRDNCVVKFPIKSSMYNSILTADSADEFEAIETVSLESVLKQEPLVSLLKVDCEGGEYDIFFNSKPDVSRAVEEIKMEFHDGQSEQLADILAKQHFKQTFIERVGEKSGNMWFRSIAHR